MKNRNQTHDFTESIWGNNITWKVLPRNQLQLIGWKKEVETGDFVLLKNGRETTRYQITEIDYFSDPSDMFRAVAVFAPRSEI